MNPTHLIQHFARQSRLLPLLLAGALAPGQVIAGEPEPAPSARAAQRSERDDTQVTRSSPRDHQRAFVLVHGRSNTMSGSTEDLRDAQSLRARYGQDFLWVREGGHAFVIDDPALLQPLAELQRRQDELGAKQSELGEQQSRLGERQSRLGEKQAALGEEQARLAERITRAVEDRDAAGMSAALSRKQESLGRKQEALGIPQRELGEQQEALGRRQEALGREQEALARTLEDRIDTLVERARAAGKAHPVQD